MHRHSVACTGKLLFRAALIAFLCIAGHAPGADFAASGPVTVRIGLARSDARKFLLRGAWWIF